MSQTPISDAAANPSYCECDPGTVVNIAKARELEMELAAISAALDKEFDPSKGDKRSGDLLDDMACFIEHHKSKERELEEFNRLFALQYSRVGAATAMWREATGQKDVLPDLGTLIEWLLNRMARLESASTQALAKLEKLHRMVEIIEADNDGKTEREVALSSSFSEAVAYQMVEEKEREIEELKRKITP